MRTSETRGIELSEDLELSRRRVKELQKALNSCISNQQQQLVECTDSEDDDGDNEEDGNNDKLVLYSHH